MGEISPAENRFLP